MFGLLLTHFALRRLMVQASAAVDGDPDDAVFPAYCPRRAPSSAAARGFFPLAGANSMLAVVLVEIRSVPAERSRGRHNPRVVKRKMSGFPTRSRAAPACGDRFCYDEHIIVPPPAVPQVFDRVPEAPEPPPATPASSAPISRSRKVRRSRIASTMSGLGASADCPAPITADSRVSIGEPLINGSPASVIYSVARCGTTNYSLNDTVLALSRPH